MEEIFSSNSLKVIEQQLDLNDASLNLNLNSEQDIDVYFDIDRISSWISKRGLVRVALQFPDELLNKSIRVCARLKLKSPQTMFFILADTSYGR